MLTYLARRLTSTILLLFLVATFAFFLVHLMPGDVAFVILGEDASEQAVARLREELGLDRSLLVQYVSYLGDLVRLDFGASLISGREVVQDLALRLPRTLEIVLVSSAMALLVGLPLGVITAVRRDTWWDYGLSTLGLIGLSAPSFVRATLLVLVFGLTLGWLPSSGFVAFDQDPLGHVLRLILPCVALALGNGAVIMRMARSSLLEVLHDDYVRTARAKGLRSNTVTFKHALRNALLPVVTILGLQMGAMFGGAVIVEAIFNWPGLSSLLLSATSRRDYPVVQAIILVIAAIYVLLNLLVDLAYAFLDPRVRYG